MADAGTGIKDMKVFATLLQRLAGTKIMGHAMARKGEVPVCNMWLMYQQRAGILK